MVEQEKSTVPSVVRPVLQNVTRPRTYRGRIMEGGLSVCFQTSSSVHLYTGPGTRPPRWSRTRSSKTGKKGGTDLVRVGLGLG